MSLPPQKRRIKLEVPKDLTASYANTVMISHTAHEVIFDFIQLIPSDPTARVQHRVIMTPVHAKMLLNALTENLGRFEERNGEIQLPQKPESLADQLFKGISSSSSDGGDEE